MALDSPLTSDELQEALNSMPIKRLQVQMAFQQNSIMNSGLFWHQHSTECCRKPKKNGRLPPNMNSANISLLLKPGKDPVLPTSYRPISLINVDTKIICKAISKRIEKITPLIIHYDQTGFIKGRHSSTNTRR